MFYQFLSVFNRTKYYDGLLYFKRWKFRLLEDSNYKNDPCALDMEQLRAPLEGITAGLAASRENLTTFLDTVTV